MAGKRVRKNLYKNSPARRKGLIIRRVVLCVKMSLVFSGMVGTSLVFILAHDALTQSSCFSAQTIIVEGNHRLSKEAILKQADVKPGDNILDVNLKNVRYRLLANPWIAAADVGREIPDTIHIRVTERVPVAKVKLDRFYYIDEMGQIVKHVEPSDQTTLPVVTGLELSDMDLSDPARPTVLEDILEVLHLSRLHGSILPLHMLDRIHVDPQIGLTLFGFDNGLAIKLGFGDYDSKFNRLRDAVAYLKQGEQPLNVECIYLNDLNRMVVRPSGGISALGAYYRKEV